jgi:hypothetical protein
MASLEQKLHDKISAGMGDSRISPATTAYKMIREGKAVNETLLSYMINYVIIMADATVVPFQLAEVQKVCKSLKGSLEELGLAGAVQRETVVGTEYISV